MDIGNALRRAGQALRCAWRVLRLSLLVLKPARVPILVVLAVLVYLVTAQGQDAVRTAAEQFDAAHRNQGSWLRFWLLASALAWSLHAWYWARVMLSIKLRGVPYDAPRFRRLRIWTPRLLGLAATLGLSFALWRASGTYEGAENAEVRDILIEDAIWCVVVALGFLAFVTVRRSVSRFAYARIRTRIRAPALGVLDLAPTSQQRFNAHAIEDLGRLTRNLMRAALVLAVALFLLFTFAVQQAAPAMGSAAIMLLAATGWVAVGSRLDLFGLRHRFPVFTTLLALAIVFSFWNDNHDVRTLAGAGAAKDDRPTLHESLRDWIGRQPSNARGEIPMLLVSAEGGGIRAAYWTGMVLGEIQDQYPCFGDQLFSLSGVSGGSLGAAVFVALLQEQRARAGGRPRCGSDAAASPPGFFKESAKALLAEDFLSPVVASFLYPDLFQRFFFLPVPAFDRARALENAWERSWRTRFGPSDRFAARFDDLWKDRAYWTPNLFLNATWVETGKRLIASNVRILSGHKGSEEFVDSEDAVRFFLPRALALSTAVHTSARFTYVSPAGTLSRDGAVHGHVVDGGYFENSAATTTLEILMTVDQMREDGKEDPRWKAVRPVVIHITNEPVNPASGLDTLDTVAQNPAIRPARWLNEVMSPLWALLAARGARGAYARETVEWRLPSRFLKFGLCQGHDRAPLGWVLSRQTRSRMEAQLRGLDAECTAAIARGMPVADNAAGLRRLADWIPRAAEVP